MIRKLSIFERLTGKSSEIVTSGAAPVVLQGRRSGSILGIEKGKVIEPSKLYAGYAYSAISILSARFASEMLRSLRVVDKSGKEVAIEKHPLGSLILNPNLGNSQFEIWEQLCINFQLNGRSFLYLAQNKNGSAYVGAEVLPSQRVSVDKYDNDHSAKPEEYIYQSPAGKLYNYKTSEILDVKQYNPTDNRQGFSTIAAAGDHLIAELAAASHIKNTLYNSGLQSLLVAIKEQMTPEDFEMFKRDFKNLYTGATNSGGTVFLNGIEVEVKEVSAKLSDLDITNISKVAIDAILSTFGVSRAMIGLESSNLNRATAEVQERQFIKNVIVPLMRKYIDSLNVWAATHTKSEYTFTFEEPSVESIDEKLIEAQTTEVKAKSVATLVGAGIDLEEAKKMAGFEDDEEVYGSRSQSSLKLDELTIAKNAAVAKAKSKLTRSKWRKWQKAYSEERIETATIELVNSLERHYSKLRARIVREFMKQNAFGVGDVYVIDEASAVAVEIRPVLMSLYGLSGKEALQFMYEMSEAKTLLESPFKPSLSLITRTSNFIDRAAKGISNTNSELIAKIIRDGLAESKTQTQIAAEIDAAFSGQIESWRSERLARTEVVRINNFGEQDGVQQWADVVGAKVSKVWRTNSTDPCEYCRSLNGTKRDISDVFVSQGDKIDGVEGGVYKNDYDDLETPPIHPNCACSVDFEVE